MLIKISVVIPAYNASKYIVECLDSIIKQSLQDIEIIVVNDGSIDDTKSILDALALEDKRLKIIHQKNQSVGVARTNGVLVAQGEYIAFVDSDDTINEDMLKTMYEKAQEKNSDIVVCNYNRVDAKGKILSKAYFSEKYLDFEASLSLKIDPPTWNKIYKKELFLDNNIHFKERVFCEDLATTMELFFFAKQIDNVDAYLYNYFINPNGASMNVTQKNVDHIFIALETNKLFLQKQGVMEVYQHSFILRILQQLDVMYSNKELYTYVNKKLQEYSYFEIQSQLISKEFLLKKSPFKQFEYLALKMKKEGISSTFIYGYGEAFSFIEELFSQLNIEILGVIESIDRKRKLSYRYGTLEHFNKELKNANIFVMSVDYVNEINDMINVFMNSNGISL